MMLRKTIVIDSQSEKYLKSVAGSSGVSESEVIREAIRLHSDKENEKMKIRKIREILDQ